jgi:hypothetical protein
VDDAPLAKFGGLAKEMTKSFTDGRRKNRTTHVEEVLTKHGGHVDSRHDFATVP